MKTIYKYEILTTDSQYITLPIKAKFMSVQEQGGIIQAWFMVDTDNPHEDKYINVRGTGHSCDGAGKYLGTVIVSKFVWHIFEAKE